MNDMMTREEAIETLRANYPDACFEQLREAVDKAIEALEADVQPVVQCRDCKYFEPDGPYEGWCHAWSGMTVDDAFCSFGEHKDGEQHE